MTNLPESFTDSLRALAMHEDFDLIIAATANAGRQFSSHNTDADNREILNDLVKLFTDRVANLVWLAGGDMDALGDSGLAYQQNVSAAFVPPTLTQAEIWRAFKSINAVAAASYKTGVRFTQAAE